jgi:hypothetical protein
MIDNHLNDNTRYFGVFFTFHDFRWLFCFVDIDGIIDYHCLICILKIPLLLILNNAVIIYLQKVHYWENRKQNIIWDSFCFVFNN